MKYRMTRIVPSAEISSGGMMLVQVPKEEIVDLEPMEEKKEDEYKADNHQIIKCPHCYCEFFHAYYTQKDMERYRERVIDYIRCESVYVSFNCIANYINSIPFTQEDVSRG